MAVSNEENLMFVVLLEENNDVLEKSQVPSAKKKKEEAIAIFIENWEKISGKVLSQSALLKKINNLKTRAKAALSKGSALTDWQSKILGIKDKDDEVILEALKSVIFEQSKEDEVVVYETLEIQTDDSASGVIGGQTGVIASTYQDFVNRFETEDTKSLSYEQLQRIAILQQIQIFELKKKKLELEISNSNPILVDISALNASNVFDL